MSIGGKNLQRKEGDSRTPAERQRAQSAMPEVFRHARLEESEVSGAQGSMGASYGRLSLV